MLLVTGDNDGTNVRSTAETPQQTAVERREEEGNAMRFLIILLIFALLLAVSGIFGFNAAAVATGLGG